MGVNNLADMAADVFSDLEGDEKTIINSRAAIAKLQAVCLRLAALESEIRRGTPERSRVEADIVVKCQAQGGARRKVEKEKAADRIAQMHDPQGHCLTFHRAAPRKLCGSCSTKVHTNQPLPDSCPTYGNQRGTCRCSRCNRFSRG